MDEIFENLNSISNIFQEPHNFLIFTNSVRSSQPKLLRKKHRRSFSRGISILKITEMGLVYLLNTLGNPSLRILLPERHLLFNLKIKCFTFYFCIWKRIDYARKYISGKCSFTITFLLKCLLVLQDI